MLCLVQKVLIWYQELPLTFQLLYFKCSTLLKVWGRVASSVFRSISRQWSGDKLKEFKSLGGLFPSPADVRYANLPLLSRSEACSLKQQQYAVGDPMLC